MSFMQRQQSNQGFGLLEVLVSLVILSILVTIGVRTSTAAWRREKANAAAIELAGWLESVRRQAIRGQGCDVTLETGPLGANADIATAAPSGLRQPDGAALQTIGIPTNHCLPNLPARVPPLPANDSFEVTAVTDNFTFTPRGTVDPIPANNAPIETRITLNPNGPGRCVRLVGMLGFVEIGTLNAGTCQYGGRF